MKSEVAKREANEVWEGMKEGWAPTVISVLRLWMDFRGFFTILFDLIFTFYRTEIERLRCTATSSQDLAKRIDRFRTISDV